ncbi:hypothetical protein [Kitasatospora sp. NPDC002965]|uniref:hypothetical protein n=1 Tax=Kitasatospora sp. NPDC002965 TaxID=3154775 RepID=UPI00339F2BE1
MPKSGRDKKRDARTRKARTGAPLSAATTGTAHQHTAPPHLAALLDDTDPNRVYSRALTALDGTAQQDQALKLVGHLLGACDVKCRPCQDSAAALAVKAVPAPVVALAAAVYATHPGPGWVASETTRALWPAIRALADRGHADDLVAAAARLLPGQRRELLEDTLDMAMLTGMTHEQIVEHMPPVEVITIPVPEPEPDTEGTYGVLVGQVTMGDGRPLPMLTLYPETPTAGLDDLRRRTDWRDWDGITLPPIDFNWRLRTDIATRSLTELVHIDSEGWDGELLWRAGESVTLPQPWWDLLDRAQHVLVVGPSDDNGQPVAGATAVLARVSFN